MDGEAAAAAAVAAGVACLGLKGAEGETKNLTGLDWMKGRGGGKEDDDVCPGCGLWDLEAKVVGGRWSVVGGRGGFWFRFLDGGLVERGGSAFDSLEEGS